MATSIHVQGEIVDTDTGIPAILKPRRDDKGNTQGPPETHGPSGTPAGKEAMMLTATLTRPNTITAPDITVTHRMPVLQLCRDLVETGHGDQPMTVVEAATGRAVMQIASIAAAAKVAVMENDNAGLRFRRWMPFPGAGGEAGVASADTGVLAPEGSETNAILKAR
jgi:hypothetical protein